MYWGTCKVTVYVQGANPKAADLETKVKFMKTLRADSDDIENLPMVGFGEIALLYNDKRTASITAITECEAWVLNGDVYKSIVAAHAIKRRNISLEYLDKVELFRPIENFEKMMLIDGLKVVNFSDGDMIIQKGEDGDLFYIMEKGEVECGNFSEDGTFSRVRLL